MAPNTVELLVVLTKLVTLLSSDGERNWSAWMLRAKTRLENSDFSGVEYLLSAYGGMGSFSDFVAGQDMVSGHFAWKPGYVALNDELDALRSQAWSLAMDIKRDHAVERS
jgi:hypothetical protein